MDGVLLQSRLVAHERSYRAARILQPYNLKVALIAVPRGRSSWLVLIVYKPQEPVILQRRTVSYVVVQSLR